VFKVLANSQVNGAIETAAGANHIRIIGMESTIDPNTAGDSPGGAIIHSNINFNKNVGGNSANLAKFIGFDRCYVHGLTNKNNRRGFYWKEKTISSSTAISASSTTFTPTARRSCWLYKDNISDYRACGVAGGGCNGSNATCSLNGVFTGWVFTNNGIMRSAGVGPNYPTGQLWVTSWGSQLVNFNSGLDGNYRIASGSTWKNAATDGKDLGADRQT
jgi:hypothetical protein